MVTGQRVTFRVTKIGQTEGDFCFSVSGRWGQSPRYKGRWKKGGGKGVRPENSDMETDSQKTFCRAEPVSQSETLAPVPGDEKSLRV